VDPLQAKAEQLWLTRDLTPGAARKALDAYEAWCSAAPGGPSCTGQCRAAYWLGLMMDEAGQPASAVQRVFDGGTKACRAAQQKDPKNAGAYFWEAVNRAKSAEISGIVSSAGQLPDLKRLVDKTDALEPGYFHGGTDRYRGAVITRTPTFLVRMKGQSNEEGERYFQKSLKFGPGFVGTRRFWAELKIKMDDTAGARELLLQALAMPDGEDPDLRVWNTHEKALTRKVLAGLGR